MQDFNIETSLNSYHNAVSHIVTCLTHQSLIDKRLVSLQF